MSEEEETLENYKDDYEEGYIVENNDWESAYK